MNEYLQSIINAFHDLLFVFSDEGVIRDYLTPNNKDDLITPREEFLDKHYRDVLPTHVSQQLEKGFTELDGGAPQYKFDYSLEINAKKQWYVAVLSKLEYEGEPTYLGAVRNITERKNRERLLSGILNTSPSAIVVLRSIRNSGSNITDFEMTHFNSMVEKLADMPEEELTGKQLSTLIPHQQQEIVDRFTTTVNTGKPVDFEYQYRSESGEISWYLCEATKFKDGVLASFLDITQQKKAEEKLVVANRNLKELNRQKDKLFSVISHDLKNALAGTLGTLDMILDEHEELSKEDILDYVTILEKRAINTSNLLHDLLLWSKNQFQQITPDYENINLKKLADGVFEDSSTQAEVKNIQLVNRVPGDISFQADKIMLKTILRNLVTNGIKFSHNDDEVSVSAQPGQETVQISVSDNGIGFGEEIKEKILDKKNTYTTPGTDGETGSGLGLDLCIDFIEMHDGEFSVKSEPGVGSTFTFSLPKHP